jgi:hypothetical protein
MPLPLSLTSMRFCFVSTTTSTCGDVPGSTYCSPLEMYSQATSFSFEKKSADWSRSRAESVTTLSTCSVAIVVLLDHLG